MAKVETLEIVYSLTTASEAKGKNDKKKKGKKGADTVGRRRR